MARKKKALIDEIERAAEVANINHRGKQIFHVAELYGPEVCVGLRPWAKRAVLSRYRP
jgi:hypothetical protein